MKELPKVLKSNTKIRFQDCDPFNHLNNAAYLNYVLLFKTFGNSFINFQIHF